MQKKKEEEPMAPPTEENDEVDGSPDVEENDEEEGSPDVEEFTEELPPENEESAGPKQPKRKFLKGISQEDEQECNKLVAAFAAMICGGDEAEWSQQACAGWMTLFTATKVWKKSGKSLDAFLGNYPVSDGEYNALNDHFDFVETSAAAWEDAAAAEERFAAVAGRIPGKKKARRAKSKKRPRKDGRETDPIEESLGVPLRKGRRKRKGAGGSAKFRASDTSPHTSPHDPVEEEADPDHDDGVQFFLFFSLKFIFSCFCPLFSRIGSWLDLKNLP